MHSAVQFQSGTLYCMPSSQAHLGLEYVPNLLNESFMFGSGGRLFDLYVSYFMTKTFTGCEMGVIAYLSMSTCG